MVSLRLHAAFCTVSLIVLGVSTPARAQSAVDEGREAFARGIAAEEGGRTAEACKEYRKSLALVRELGPMRKVAACDAKDGRVLAASRLLEEIGARLPPEDPERAAVDAELAGVKARAGRLTIRVRSDAPPGMRAKLDAEVLTIPSSDVLVDPGAHQIVVEAPGVAPRILSIEIGEGKTLTLDVPPPEPTRAAPPPRPSEPQRQVNGPPDLSIAGWIMTGLGLSGFVVAGATGGKLIADHADFEDCKARPDCDPRPLADDAEPLLVVNAIGWGVGAVGLGVGATLLIVDAVQDTALEAEVGPGHASLRVRF